LLFSLNEIAQFTLYFRYIILRLSYFVTRRLHVLCSRNIYYAIGLDQ